MCCLAGMPGTALAERRDARNIHGSAQAPAEQERRGARRGGGQTQPERRTSRPRQRMGDTRHENSAAGEQGHWGWGGEKRDLRPHRGWQSCDNPKHLPFVEASQLRMSFYALVTGSI